MSEYKQGFTSDQLRALDIAARVSSCLSLTGATFTILSFCLYPPLRKPVNRLAVSIATANVFACLAYSWGRYPIKAGRNSAWCQTQGFFINWFVMTDPILVMIMAFNVLLTVRTKRKATELKKADVYLILFAFMVPFVPALVFLCWRPNGKTVYGEATMWCWIAKESDILRLVAFYIPIWVMILISIALFALSGKQILLVRKKVKIAKSECSLHSGPYHEPSPRDRRFSSFAKALLLPNGVKSQSGPPPASLQPNTNSADPFASQFKGLEPLAPIHTRDVLDVDVEVDAESLEITHIASEEPSPFASPLSPVTLDRSGSSSDQGPLRRTSSRFDSIHWKYAKFALLCTIVLFITWVPISVNRVYNNFIAPNHQIYGLYLTSAICIPLHGFGNFIIYLTTSWTECKEFITCAGRRGSIRSSRSIQQVTSRSKLQDQMRRWADSSVDFGRRHFKTRRNRKERPSEFSTKAES